MQIETFKVESKTGELDTIAGDVNSIEIIKQLGLAGQEKLCNTTTQTRAAFRRMTKVEEEVYTLLFPEKTLVKQFETEIIPARVLETLKEATETNFFCDFQVWHARTKKEDPILVGLVGKANPQSWNKDYIDVTARHLIARWGDALLPFDKLIILAKKVWIDSERLDLTKIIAEKQRMLNSLELEAEVKFATV